MPLIVEEQENLIPKNSNNEPMASMAHIWREGFFGGLGGHGKACFLGVGQYSLVRTYVRSYNSFCNLCYQMNA